MLKSLLIGLVALAALLIVVGFLLPDDRHVERSIVIDAPICTVFTQVTDFRRFNKWSPWFSIDPDAQYTLTEPYTGPGAKMSWTSEHRDVGSGSQEIKSVDPYKEVKVYLDFGDQGHADAYYRLSPEGESTRFTWGFDTSFDGNFIGRYFGLFMDSMVGPSFEDGLARLKTLAEGLPDTDWCDKDVEEVDLDSRFIVSTKGKSGSSPEEIGPALATAYGRVMGFVGKRSLVPAGAPFAIAESWGEDGYRFEAGMPLASNPGLEIAEDASVIVREVPATRAVRMAHVGPYHGLPATYKALEAYLAARGLEPSGNSWEEYMSDPAKTAEDQLLTQVFMPIGG